MTIYDPVIILKPDQFTMAETSRVDSFVKIEGKVTIGEYVHVASFAHIGIGGGELVLEDYSAVASGCRIVTGSNKIGGLSCSAAAPADMQVVERGKVVIEKYAVLFVNATVLPGVTVHEGAAIAAGAVVTKDVAAWEIWGGVPAKKIGERKPKPSSTYIEGWRPIGNYIPPANLPSDWTIRPRGVCYDILDGRGDVRMHLPLGMNHDVITDLIWKEYNRVQAGGY